MSAAIAPAARARLGAALTHESEHSATRQHICTVLAGVPGLPEGACAGHASDIPSADKWHEANGSLEPELRVPTIGFALHGDGRMANLILQHMALLGLAAMSNRMPMHLKTGLPYSLFRGSDQAAPEAAHSRFSRHSLLDDESFGAAARRDDDDQNVSAQSLRLISRLVSMPSTKRVGLRGYMASHLYLVPSLRDTLQLAPEYSTAAQRWLHKHTPPTCGTYVGMHVRRGDKIYHEWEPSAGQAFYTAAWSAMSRLLGGAPFCTVVATDDEAWARRLLLHIRRSHDSPSRSLMFLSTNSTPAFDWALLRSLNHSVIATGSFGWTSAWLQGGHVVYRPFQMRQPGVTFTKGGGRGKPMPRTYHVANPEAWWPKEWSPICFEGAYFSYWDRCAGWISNISA